MEGRPRSPRRALGTLAGPALAAGFAAAWIVGGIGRSGASDPQEADAADLARRVAVHALGAGELARPDDPTSIPTLTDLGMGELPFTSMALSFRLFGFHEWSGRLPLALWGVAGALSLYALLHRLVSPRAGFYAVVALSTMPLYFLHARTMAGDIVAMAAFSMATAGLALGACERRAVPRALALALACAGLAAGLLTRGLLVGVAAPLSAAGVAILSVPSLRRRSTFALTLGWSAALGGAAAAAWFYRVAAPLVGEGAPLSRLVGVALYDPTPSDSTFDRLIRQLGHALFPWSPLVPLAIGHLARASGDDPDADVAERAALARATLLAGAALAFGAQTFLVPWTGPTPYVGVAMLAGAIGLAADDLRRVRPPRSAALVAAALAFVLMVDLEREPSRSLAGLGTEAASFPISFAEDAKHLLSRAGLAIALASALLLSDDELGARHGRVGAPRAALAAWARARRADARVLGKELLAAFRGNAIFAAVIVEAWLIGQAAMVAIGGRAGWEQIRKLPLGAVTVLVNAWWAVPLGVVLAALSYVLVRDGLRALARALGLSRGSMLMIAVGGAGTWLSLSFHRQLGDQLSPRGAFESYRAARDDGEELALLGTSPRAGALYFDAPLPLFPDVASASTWLAAEGAPRRFMVLKAKDLPRLNSVWRARYRRSVAVLDARSSQNVLVSNVGGQAASVSPFDEFLFDQPPPIARPLSARFLDHIELLGWDLIDETGAQAEVLVPRKKYKARFYLRVDKRLAGSWLTFLHIDGLGKRYAVDHAPLAGKYPMNLWQPGDILREELEINLEPNFVPGEYWLFFGFFEGETRMRVTEGQARDNRVVIGKVEVR